MRISSFMKRKVKTVTIKQTLRDAAKVMVSNKIGSVVIIDDQNKPIGIVTKGDVVRHFISGDVIDTMKSLQDFVNEELNTLKSNATLEDVKAILEKKKKHHIVVVDAENGKLAGIISTMDVIEMQTKISKAFPYFIRS